MPSTTVILLPGCDIGLQAHGAPVNGVLKCCSLLSAHCLKLLARIPQQMYLRSTPHVAVVFRDLVLFVRQCKANAECALFQAVTEVAGVCIVSTGLSVLIATSSSNQLPG